MKVFVVLTVLFLAFWGCHHHKHKTYNKNYYQTIHPPPESDKKEQSFTITEDFDFVIEPSE